MNQVYIINIHVAATYGDKPAAIYSFKNNFNLLSDNCKMRMALENDDTLNDYSIDDLLPIAKELKCAVTYDLHHYKFCQGELSAKEALEEAMKTWGNIKPVVHWSESPEDLTKRRSAHSDYVTHLDLFGYEYDVDIMIESKCKELALLRYRNKLLEK